MKKYGRDRHGNQRHRCLACGKMFSDKPVSLLGDMRVSVEDAKLALRLLVEGMSIRSTERTTGMHRDTICKLLVFFGEKCRTFLDGRMRNLSTMTHLQFDEQWTFVKKKQSRLTTDEKSERYDQGDIYLWTCIDQKTKLMPGFLIGKRSADNARRYMMDIASRVVRPNAHATDAHAYLDGGYKPTLQISTDGFAAYPEAVDLAFGPHARYGPIIKEYRNAKQIYTPSEMVGTKRTGIRGIDNNHKHTINTSHVERLNGTQRTMMARLRRLTLCFSKKLRNLEAAFGMFAAYYNFCWQTRIKGKSGKKRPSAAMMAKIEGHVWSFEELFNTVLS
jgi:IS1 family transposase